MPTLKSAKVVVAEKVAVQAVALRVQAVLPVQVVLPVQALRVQVQAELAPLQILEAGLRQAAVSRLRMAAVDITREVLPPRTLLDRGLLEVLHHTSSVLVP